MCVWGQCIETTTTQRCKYCGTQFCTACHRGDFIGVAPDFERCFICHSSRRFIENIPDENARRYTAEHLAAMHPAHRSRVKKSVKGGKSKDKSKKKK